MSTQFYAIPYQGRPMVPVDPNSYIAQWVRREDFTILQKELAAERAKLGDVEARLAEAIEVVKLFSKTGHHRADKFLSSTNPPAILDELDRLRPAGAKLKTAVDALTDAKQFFTRSHYRCSANSMSFGDRTFAKVDAAITQITEGK